MRTCGGDIAV